MQTLFWISLSVLFYTYIGYGALLVLLTRWRTKKNAVNNGYLPPLTVVVPAYNEEAVIAEKISNSLALRYPAGKLSLVFVTDGSTDGTVEAVRHYPQLRLLHQPLRQGKAAAINRAMQTVDTPVVVFTDANSLLHPESLPLLAKHFAQEDVGGVSGEKRIAKTTSAVGAGERLYWQYESVQKKANADFYTLVGAAGEIFAMRTGLFSPLPAGTVIDDFALSATICEKGFRIAYEPEAHATEAPSASLAEERKRKRRISAGCYRFLFSRPSLLNPLRHLRFSFQYLSYRVLRWVACPLLLPLLFFSNALLLHEGMFYTIFFLLQCVFCGLAIIGTTGLAGLPRLLLLPGYFLFMVSCQYQGFYRFITSKQDAAWEKAGRETAKVAAAQEAHAGS